MAKKTGKRKTVGLVSETTGHRHYYTTKNEQNHPDKLRLRKYNPVLRAMDWYTETKKSLGRNVVKEKKH